MKERGILFSAPMVRALLDGRKTQTRRILFVAAVADAVEPHSVHGSEWWPWKDGERGHTISPHYGLPGDRLWVRESYRFDAAYDKLKPRDVPAEAAVFYEAGGSAGAGVPGKLHPGIHLPRKFGRIVLELSEIRVERLQDISEADAEAEGCLPCECFPEAPSYVCGYRQLWSVINGPRSWDLNPWVWVLTFRREP